MKQFNPNDDDFSHALTFDEWSGAGFWIRKGSKAVGFSPDGKALFLPNQVTPARRSFSSSRTMWEKSADRASAKGTPWGVVEDFDSFVREAGMLPDSSRRRVFAVNDPMERYFMGVADKHGILDAILDGDEYY